jgi:hypothetical protein
MVFPPGLQPRRAASARLPVPGSRRDTTSRFLERKGRAAAKLQEYSARNEAKAGWFFLTGTKENVDHTLYKLGQYVDDPKDHKHVMIIGNPMTGLWKKALGTAKTTELLTIVNSVLNDSRTAK